MKKLYILLITALCSFTLMAEDLTGVRIYINPGHGGYDGNDRSVATLSHPIAWDRVDTLGFWESSSNLTKGLYLRDLLEEANASVMMSRTNNSSGIRDEGYSQHEGKDLTNGGDRYLSDIGAEANAMQADAFLSIHSNAANGVANYLYLIYRGVPDDDYKLIPWDQRSKDMALVCWPYMLDNPLTDWTHYYPLNMTNVKVHSQELGVLNACNMVGFLSEGQFHDYLPEACRLINEDYRKLESLRFFRFYLEYFNGDKETKGTLAGYVKDKDKSMEISSLYSYHAGSDDEWTPINGAEVVLRNANGDSINVYTVDNEWNGVFVFYNLPPGNYKLEARYENYETKTINATVTAGQTSNYKIFLRDENAPDPEEIPDNYASPIQDKGLIALNSYSFAQQGSSASAPTWLSADNIKRIIYRNNKLYVLTKEPKILIINTSTLEIIKEMNLTGIEGGLITISDIAFTADNYLLACNKENISLPETQNRYFKVYTWQSDDDAPELYFQTQANGNWAEGTIGETMAVSGPTWALTVYTPAITTTIPAEGTPRKIRILGIQKKRKSDPVSKYMMDDSYTEASWGSDYQFMISPRGSDHIIVTSNILSPTEYQFDITLPNRSSLIKKGVFTSEGYNLFKTNGSSYFRYSDRSYMAAPVAQEGRVNTAVVLFDITNGLNNAVKLSDEFPSDGIANVAAPYMTAYGVVTNYDITLHALAENQGHAAYKTTSGPVVARVYASELKAEKTQSGYDYKFTLNENADEVEITLTSESTNQTFSFGSLDKGRNTVSISKEQVSANGNYTWEVKASNNLAPTRPIKVTDNANPLLQFYGPRGVAVDNHTESPFFGRVYASETLQGKVTDRTTERGIYILNAALEDVTEQGASSYKGGVNWTATDSPFRLATAPDGSVYLTDLSSANSGVWIMDPANPSAAFTPVFSQSLTKNSSGLASNGSTNVHGPISHCWIEGADTDTKLYTFDKNYTGPEANNTGNILRYDIGNLETAWEIAPSAVIYSDGKNGNLQQNFNSCIAPDGRGGWWISQFRYTDAPGVPSLIHMGTDGLVDFNSGNTTTLIGSSVMGGMAVNGDYTKIAMGTNNEVRVFDVIFSEEGVPSLELYYTIKPALGQNTGGIAFDKPGNIYIISNSQERLGVWGLPVSDNSFTTPAPSAQTVTYSTETDVSKQADATINISPNPMRDILNIKSDKVINSVKLIDLSGRTLINTVVNNYNITLNTSDVNAGSYILIVNEKAIKVIKN